MSDLQVERGFSDRWQREFRQSRHPLGRALHRFVKFDELKKSSAAANYLYSRSTFNLIDDAKAVSNTPSVEAPHRLVVRVLDVVAALLLRVQGGNRAAHSGNDHAIEQRLASAVSGLTPTEELERLSLVQ